MPISVSIVEDNRITRQSLASLLNRAPGIRCISAYANGETAAARIPLDKPDLALVDINLPGMSGIECVAKLKLELPSLVVLMLTTYEESELIFNSIRAGAAGYLLKKMVPAELIQAVTQAHAGGAPMSMEIARKVVDHFRQIVQPKSEAEELSKREQEVLTLLSQGCLYKEISEKLGISVGTIRTYVQRSCEKLHVQSRMEATVKFGQTHRKS